jgi:hypothetical protein
MRSNGKELLSVLEVRQIDEVLLPPNPRRHMPDSNNYVSDGHLKVSKERLFTYAPNTCVAVVVIGKTEVFLQHLAAWNAKGKPYSDVPRKLKSFLPKDFIFVSGYVIPGFYLNEKLLWGQKGDPILQDLLWEYLEDISWKQCFTVIKGCRQGFVIEASTKRGLEIYKSFSAQLMEQMPLPSLDQCAHQ